MLYRTLKCGIALMAIDTVLAAESATIDIFSDKNDCSTGAVPSSIPFLSSNCNQICGPNALMFTDVNGNEASGSQTDFTCQAFTSMDCSGTALNLVIDGTVQSDTNWGTLIGQCAGFIEHICSWNCQGQNLAPPDAIAMRTLEGNLTGADEAALDPRITTIDLVITGVQTLVSGVTAIGANCPSGQGTTGQCVVGAMQTVVGATLAAIGGFFFGQWKRDEDGRIHINVTHNDQGLPGNRLYHFLPNDTTHKISAYHADGNIYDFSYYFNQTAESHHVHAPFTTTELSRRQTCNEGDFCLDGDDGYGGTFFDGDSAVWDTVQSNQISGFGQKMFDGLTPTDGDSACAELDDPNGEIASLWYQPANDATFQSDINGCNNFTPAKRAATEKRADPPDWVGPLAISSGINFIGGVGAAIDNCNMEGGNGAGCVANAVSSVINGFIGLAAGAIKFFQFLPFGGRDGQPALASDMVHDVSDLLGGGSKLLVHHNSTTGVVRVHASFGELAGGSKYARQVDGDTGFAGVFFDANSNEWAGADEMPTSQVPAAANKTLDYMETNNFDSACLDFVDSNSGDTAASLWMQMANSGDFMSTENGCPNIS